jgi:serine/threonine-protein kinase
VGFRVGRYVVYDELAAGGMATVHYGRMLGSDGFARTVAIKRLHGQYAKDPDFIAMFVDEARLAARIRHPNVVAMLDIAREDPELLLVMEYVAGATLSMLLRAQRERNEPAPIAVVSTIVASALLGLHAAHEALDDQGQPIGLVHRDVSPQNILVGVDGTARIADFGIAKAAGRLQTTRDGVVKGKAAYMAPEQIRGHAVDRRADVYAAGVVLWEALTGERLFDGDSPLAIMNAVLDGVARTPRSIRADIPAELEAVVVRAIARDPKDRYATAREMAVAIEASARSASTREIGDWVESVGAATLAKRAARVRDIETGSDDALARPLGPTELGEMGTANAQVSEVVASRRARWVTPLAVGAAVAILGGALALWARPKPAVVPAAPVTSQIAAPVPKPEATVSPIVQTAPPPSASATQPAPARPAHRPSASSPKRCDPPFTVDSHGVQHWKDGC